MSRDADELSRTRMVWAALNEVIEHLRIEVTEPAETALRLRGRVRRQVLLDRLDELLQDEDDGFSPPAVHAPAVVIVDDDAVCRMAVAVHLHALGLTNPRITAHDGEQAVRILRDLLQRGEPPALVLLDGHMPTQNGLEVLTWIRSQRGLDDTAVVMLTGDANVSWIGQAYSLGVASYLVKPVGLDGLADVLRALTLPWSLQLP